MDTYTWEAFYIRNPADDWVWLPHFTTYGDNEKEARDNARLIVGLERVGHHVYLQRVMR